jgi:riboflavin kinase / FMN adenylyltransferase
MRVIRHLARVPAKLRRVVLTLGNFDGVHLGHQAILSRAVAEGEAAGGQVVALTFEPHPARVLAPERAPERLQPLHDRLARFQALGIAVAVVQRFTRSFAAVEADAFVEDLLLQRLELIHVVVGYNVSFGRHRGGSIETLRRLGARHGFAVDAVGPVTLGAERVSSTAVRRAVAAGDVRRAADLLGAPFTLRRRVVHGEERGRTLGFPTANLHMRHGLLLPADGVYAARVRHVGAVYGGVLNIGIRPTFGQLTRTVEVHILDFDGDLYGQQLKVEFVERLRGEQRFSGIEALRAAIAGDTARARAMLSVEPTPARGRP